MMTKEFSKNVVEVVNSRQRLVKKHLYGINVHFEPTFNAEMALRNL